MAGTTVYAVAMHALVLQVQRHNQAVAKEQGQVRAEQAALEAEFQTKKKELVALEKQLYEEKLSTAKVDAQLKAVRRQIQLIKAGHIPGAVGKMSSVSTKTYSAPPNLSSVSSLQPPSVQGVTRASAP